MIGELKRKNDDIGDNMKNEANDLVKAEAKRHSNTACIVFSLHEECGALADALNIFKKRLINLKHIESRPSKWNKLDYEFFVEIEESEKSESIKLVLEDLKVKTKHVMLHTEESVPWFPRKISELDNNCVINRDFDSETDHPGFKDPVYRARRKELADIAINYRYGEPLPRVEYTEEEISVWDKSLTELTKLFTTHACHEINYMFPFVVEKCNYRVGAIPQLADVSRFLKDCTGFTLRPISGFLTLRQFLGGFAFRVHHATQYVRHSKIPMHTPEPDCIHELIGHVPLFADPSFAQFAQEIGLASLGAPDEWLSRLSALYWYTLEVGICRQNGELKAYGAALLSSSGELEYCLSGKPEHLPLDPEKVSLMEFNVLQYQPQYFIAESLEDAKEKVRAWMLKIPRPFTVNYNPYTETVEILDTREKIVEVIQDVKSNLETVINAMNKLIIK